MRQSAKVLAIYRELRQTAGMKATAGDVLACATTLVDLWMAKYMVKLIERMEGETPIQVHSQMSNADSKIRAFRNTDKRWLVSVAMVSESVDIPRLRLPVYMPHALTELAFRQAFGRVVRTAGRQDDTRAYVVMPCLDTLETYARRVEEEMPSSARATADDKPRTRKCPSCRAECGTNSSNGPGRQGMRPLRPQVSGGGAEVPWLPGLWALNPVTATTCHACGTSLAATFSLTLDEALRTGAIVRGMDIDEDEVREAEEIALEVRDRVLRSGDDELVKIQRVLPDESWVRLREIVAA